MKLIRFNNQIPLKKRNENEEIEKLGKEAEKEG